MRDFYRTLLENSLEGTESIDAAGRIAFQNRAVAQTLGARGESSHVEKVRY
jgi:PAS domain-containing protein